MRYLLSIILLCPFLLSQDVPVPQDLPDGVGQGLELFCPAPPWFMWWYDHEDIVMPFEAEDSESAEVVDALLTALRSSKDKDLTAACLIALGKLWPQVGGADLHDVFVPALSSEASDVREAAALALGLSRDGQAGVVLIKRLEESSDARLRAFSGYGLGFLLASVPDPDLQVGAGRALLALLADSDVADEDVVSGVMFAASMLQSFPLRDTCSLQMIEEAFVALYRSEKPIKARAAALPAMTRLLLQHDAPRERIVKMVLADLQLRSPLDRRHDFREAQPLSSSAAIALGHLASTDYRRIAEALVACVWDKTTDDYTRHEALIALARIGGPKNRQRLLSYLDSRPEGFALESAIGAIGFFEHRRLQSTVHARPDPELFERLMSRIGPEAWGVSTQSVTVLAVGLAKQMAAVPELRVALRGEGRFKGVLRATPCESVALVLGWLGDEDSRAVLRRLMAQRRRPFLVRGAAIGLGRLGDSELPRLIGKEIERRPPNLASVSSYVFAAGRTRALGVVGTLLQVLGDEKLPARERAIYAWGLADVLGWQKTARMRRIVPFLNLHALPLTISDRVNGLLDIL